MFDEEVINGVVYLVNKQTGEKIKISDVINQVATSSIGATTQTPLSVTNTSTVKDRYDENINQITNTNKTLMGALDNQVTGALDAGNTAKDKFKNFDDLTLPKMEEKKTMTDEDGNQISFRDALPKFNEWKEQTGWKLPDRTDDKYQVDEKEFKYEQTDRERLGGQLQILGAMFQELGNPKLYKGQTAAVGEAVLARKEGKEEVAFEKYKEAMAVAKANYDGDVDTAQMLLDEYGIQVEDVQNQIKAITDENAQIQQEFDNAITIFDKKMKTFVETNKQILDEYDIEMANLELLPSAIKEKLSAQINLGNAFVEGMNLRDKMLEINQAEASLVQSLSKDFKAMNTIGDSRYPLTWEQKLNLLSEQAGDSQIAQNFVKSFPKTRAEYDKAETTNLMDHAEQIIGVAQQLGLPDEFNEYILAEKILGVKVGTLDTVASQGLKYSDEDIEGFVQKSQSALRVYETASGIQQQLENGTYSASGIDKFIADSKILNAFAAFGEAAGFETDIQSRFEELKKSTGGTQQAMAGLIVELIPLFTGEEGARKTTFDVTYTGESINNLKQQFEKGILTTTEGQKNALDLIKTIAKDSAQYNYKEAEQGKPSEPTDELFAEIDARFSGETTGSLEPTDDDRANFNRLVTQTKSEADLKAMFNNADMKAQVKSNNNLKLDLYKNIQQKFPSKSATQIEDLIEELLN